MTMKITAIIAGAFVLGATALVTVPASATPAHQDGASPLVLVASGGWAARSQGKTSTYGPAYGYGDAYGYPQAGYGYAEGRYGYRGAEPVPYGYEGGEGYNAY